MADEEQFSLCWNNFNTNLSAGFHESLCRGDLVDVTLAAEGQLVKAHRLVLSVCSPYFRKMFTQMPANQHAFVFLKDVSSSALKDLIQFMYCGEVNVKQEALPAFISTAEALQIKGLTESSEATVSAAASSPTKEAHVTSTPLPDTASTRTRTAPRVIAARPQAFKVESEGSSDEKQTITLVQTGSQPVKRAAVRSSLPTVAPKRQKTQISISQETPDPLDAETHETLKESGTEFIDLPMETTTLNPKTEPEYVEDTQEIETEQDDDHQYVEDVTYGEEKYEESYFTEGDTDKAGVSGFSETYATEGDQSATEAQVEYTEIIMYNEGKPEHVSGTYSVKEIQPFKKDKPVIKKEKTNLLPMKTSYTVPFYFTDSGRRNQVLICEGRKYIQNNKYGDKVYYKCSNWHSGCKARAITLLSQPDCIIRRNEHNHPNEKEEIIEGESANE